MPAPVNPFPTWYTDLAQTQLDITSAYSFAETEMSNNGIGDFNHLDLEWSGGKVKRRYDGAQVSTLGDKTMLKYYEQLKGLYKLAVNNKLYP